MNESQALLQKIASLRASREPAGAASEPVQQLEQEVSAGFRSNVLLDGSLRQLADPNVPAGQVSLPAQLTARARRLLEMGRDLLTRLRNLGGSLQGHAENRDPLAEYYSDTVAMADTSLRMVQAFPDAPSAQLQLCAGLEVILTVVADRTAQLGESMARRRRDDGHAETLRDILLGLEAGQSVAINPLIQMAEAIVAEAKQAAPLRLFEAPLSDHGTLARHIACHGLNVAQVAARLVKQDPELHERPLDLVLSALLHDVGMLLVPVDILGHKGPLGDEQRREVEAHALVGADMVLGLFPNADWLREAVTSHHERIDGTGYPSGLRDLQISPLVRLLSVCDVYAALCTARPQRPARDTRDALADTLLLAEQGTLDRAHAERLLTLSFYPVGAVVELADGSVGVVVATHMGRRDLNTPACPVVALLVDGQRRSLPSPRHLDLSECAGQGIVRSLSPSEGRALMAKRHPHLAA